MADTNVRVRTTTYQRLAQLRARLVLRGQPCKSVSSLLDQLLDLWDFCESQGGDQ